MPLITLTTEWREDDVFNGIVKGKLSSACPGATVVNNAAAIPPLNIMHGAFVVRNTYSHYPEETIHMIFISSEGSGENPHLLVRSHNHWFIGADNGMFNLILNAAPDLIISLDNSGNDDEITLFVGAAAALVNGKSPESLGKKITSLSEKVPLRATIDRNVIIGSVIFIDSYGNAITNITREVFFRVFEGREFRIMIKSNNYYTEKISRYYSDEPVGEIVTRFNTIDLLELSINGANLCQLFAVETGDAVRVEARNQDRENNSLF
ncbi:MAG: SAM-dependent chlorinase/fluorinase [Bacteroidales bacterium]|jgi:S-adenosylmethionine hydrolase|nr:SAM-dependent chlorinase/fluorinase [Bacteroidales bacterium]MCB9028886.1 SAM-dependent chlorinase/fluorinase [Bacteroidales bacterium]MDD3736328.1 SAM-dependent chlorinase/fluorinase [Bacteroidales bacterium]NLD64003.1 SAM-dependent chlorinase/fluorinase [Bacteroidales bacterium]HNT92722.1 SAM-dependent chlorinase/fluorinase [Bacteroidales bacterium]